MSVPYRIAEQEKKPFLWERRQQRLAYSITRATKTGQYKCTSKLIVIKRCVMNKVSKVIGIIASIYTMCFSVMILMWMFKLMNLPGYFSVVSDIYLAGGFVFSLVLIVLGLISNNLSNKFKKMFIILGVIGLILAIFTFYAFQ